MEGYVNIQNQSYLGLLCYNLFNASIERRRLPKGWRWDGPTMKARPRSSGYNEEGDHEEEEEAEQEPEGTFLDEKKKPVTGDRLIKFKFVDWEVDQSGRPAEGGAAGLFHFEGTMLSDEGEEQLLKEMKVKEADRLKAEREEKENRDLRIKGEWAKAAAENRGKRMEEAQVQSVAEPDAEDGSESEAG